MSLNQDVQSSPKENYMNGFINDFTDCIDFTKQYQKSCGFEEENIEALSDLRIPVIDKKETNNSGNDVGSEEKQEQNHLDKIYNTFPSRSNASAHPAESSKNDQNNVPETDYHPMEPDVSITIRERHLAKNFNHVRSVTSIEKDCEKPTEVDANNICDKKSSRQKLVKKNHLKLPVNKNIKKKVALFKLKNGKYMKKKSESFQCQGIQSNVKFKCYKCSYSDLSSISELQCHQRKCTSNTTDIQSVNESPSAISNSSSSNFRITRKVYLCSACGSYYENWNLFLHMKEMHKRHICLYCLGMFSQPDKLAQHLQTKHNVIEQTLSSSDEFFKFYRGTCYLICVTCEAMFSEQEDFTEHSCLSESEDTSSCPLCGLQGAHFPTCRRAYSDRYVEPECPKSHPALGKKLNIKKKKVKTNKKTKEMFQIVSNDTSGEMSMIVRKQNLNDIEPLNDSKIKETRDVGDTSVMASLINSNEDFVSTKHFNEKMLQLYKPNKVSSEKVTSSIQSIEDSINRVVENLRLTENSENEKEEEDESEYYDGEHCSDGRREEPHLYENENNSSPAEQQPPLVESRNSNYTLETEEKDVVKLKEEQNGPKDEQEPEESNKPNVRQKADETSVLSESESTDSEKLTIAFDNPSEQCPDKGDDTKVNSTSKAEDHIPTASTDTSYIHVSVKDECTEAKSLIKEFVKVSCWNCVYCSHAKRIALNGKQLVLHILAEHRFVTVPESSCEEEKEKSALDIIDQLKSTLNRLQNVYFNTDTFDSEDKSFWKVNDRIYECFHCLFATYVHKELCSHNRKMHQKAMFLCIMCKSNFYTYSELLCHLCPGIYVSGQMINPDITYRCFLCDVEPLPSSFRLMVHLRRKHNSCDICFDQSSNQFQLSTHVWKHKLSHMCYRCGIAYRNKPDITKHLFWKHGTESVLCKKCLQKKWPHVYHFCVPPNSFLCDECSISLKSAVALRVHKRLHAGDYPHRCTKCDDKFISRKLLAKHLEKHDQDLLKVDHPETEIEEPPETDPEKPTSDNVQEPNNPDLESNCTEEADIKPEKEKKSKKKKVLNDVFDLPPVNLSESDDSDQEESEAPKVFKSESPIQESSSIPNGYPNNTIPKDEPSPTQIVDGVWNNFQNYLVAKDMPKTFRPPSPFRKMTLSRIKEIMLSDHDYHIIPNSTPLEGNQSTIPPDGETPSSETKKVGLDHDYCNNVQKGKTNCKSKQKTKHKDTTLKSSSSDSSSDSDSSCSCGSNCSCSSGSSSSTSSNDSDSDSREKRKQKKAVKNPKESTEGAAEAPPELDISVHDVSNENFIKESDLDTEETETDEDFYDYNPAREANRILAEKRTQLLANLNGSETAMSSPTVGPDKQATPKKKTKLKKKRSQARSTASINANRKKAATSSVPFNRNKNQSFPAEPSVVGDTSANLSYNTSSNEIFVRSLADVSGHSPGERETKRPKRKRVPLKFYGFSSDEEGDATPASKKREKSELNTTTPAPATPTTSSGFEVAGDGISGFWTAHPRASLSWKIEKTETSTPKVNPIKIRTSQAGGKLTPTVESAVGTEYLAVKRPIQVNGNPVANKGEKLYCFCQCPYDEVSEMIACDAEDCLIEWFHFECVGIMVPPKGSWYCPDCRKRLAAENEFMSPPASEDT